MTHLRQRMQEDLRLCSVRMGEIPPCDSGVCTWPRAEASNPAIGPSSPLLASWQPCFTASGSPRSHTSRSMEEQPEEGDHV